ncbi:MAG TPA: SusC/RagA family TonB-linked outer membrane protein [Chitinophaga sp.]|uniref:SusC/RagA family TonB-linked outer membrane protein n=1 Tax=Chitinophaga sp. TaxID=1869181 RepID=UPI002C47E300|nr:SusC/RagA family TonB-linked outer membrane protein [Chitinophaga sp.]HVI48124.1 SusC/RagA family TonB-linked outer membrane protein [Chitinophaga sp.]
MKKIYYWLLTIASFPAFTPVYAQGVLFKSRDTTSTPVDSAALRRITVKARDSSGIIPNNELFLLKTVPAAISSPDMSSLRMMPYTSIDQMLTGRVTGVDIRTPTAEPGKRNSIFIRGTSSLLLKNSDLFYLQPTYVVDGIPLIADHAFAYDIQRFDFNRLGTETNLSSFINVNDIESIEVLKDFAASAKYGPMAANGIINITTKGPRVGQMKVSVNAYAGISLRPAADAVNGKYESDFRLPFYRRYANETQWRNFPRYLADSSQPRYFGPANWDDLFYRNAFTEGIQASVSGGSPFASFRFSIGQSSQQGVADKTGLQRYNVNFGINIVPIRNLVFSTYIGVATLNRKRNEFLRDRAGDEDYLFNYETPLSPNKEFLQQYYTDLTNGINKNRNNSARIIANAQYSFLSHFTWNTRFAIDYGQNFRDYFVPTALSEGNSFVSNFDGLSKRLVLDNSLRFQQTFAQHHHLDVVIGQYSQWDKWRYDYGRAYKGKSDYIKIYQPGNDDNKQGRFTNLRLMFNAKDYTQSNLASFYLNAGYNYQQKYFLTLYVRRDGTSYLPANQRWLMSPTVSAAWKISGEKFLQSSWLSNLNLRASWGRVGRLLMDELYKGGPIYNVDAGWTGTPNMSTYNAFPAINAAFGTGYVAPGTTWPYVEQLNGGLDVAFLHDRIRASLDIYSKTDRNLVLKVPTQEEEGYTGVIKNGMAIRNYGYEFSVEADVIRNRKFTWTTALNVYTNQNKLLSLPDGLTDLVIDHHRFLVGKPTDRYWLLINEGIYQSDNDVPVNPATGKRMSYQGLPLKKGDPEWKDLDGNYDINDKDRILTGRMSPAATGGFSNTFRYRDIELSFLLNYSFGRKVINEVLANRFDFANREGVDDPKGIKEITYWEKVPGDYSKIPLYNPWSAVYAYQPDQTLFLEDASFIKLRAVTLAWHLHSAWMKRSGIEYLRIYATGNNLLTWTRYKGGDPEAVSYFGYDEGYYNWAAPRTFTVGFNFQF